MSRRVSDPHRAFNLTHQAYVGAVQAAQGVGAPLLVLGGGGYNAADTARTWAHATCALAEAPPLPRRVPENAFFEEFAPSFSTKPSPPTGAEDQNDAAHVRSLAEACTERVSHLRPPPPAAAAAVCGKPIAGSDGEGAGSGPPAPARMRPARAGGARLTRRKRRRKGVGAGADCSAGGVTSGGDGLGAFDLLGPEAGPADGAEPAAGGGKARGEGVGPAEGGPGE